ncbi:hypothetical protein LX32DRAFT_9183 [Colletotrichum zoysiae]|uniref:Uncharacterized protein n=1 Tax=Colletotrichum zoysiae TaxID=1216348 RepID=A0AAD9HDC4_9PEZI|nr:hypothetical protein LX32DRAFT_9183 [Colletotrichum zoysiae]
MYCPRFQLSAGGISLWRSSGFRQPCSFFLLLPSSPGNPILSHVARASVAPLSNFPVSLPGWSTVYGVAHGDNEKRAVRIAAFAPT